KEPIEALDRSRRVVVTEPPEPVRAFANCEQTLERVRRATMRVEALLRSHQQLPRPILLRMADPRRERPVPPAPGAPPIELGRCVPPIEMLRERRQPYPRCRAQPPVKRVEKVVSVLGVVLPCVLPVECDRP